MFSQQKSQLRLWQLISPTLPIGSFAYSQGLEYAVESGWIDGEAKTAEWIKGQIRKTLSTLDIPVMRRLYDAWQSEDKDKILYWNQWLLAARESKELYDEDIQLGQSLNRVLKGLNINLPIDDDIEWTYAAMFAYASVKWEIPFADSATGLLWAWCENQVAAAVKLVPLGQTSGQNILSEVLEEIPAAIEATKNFKDDEIGVLAPGLGIASALHETQYSRLFRS